LTPQAACSDNPPRRIAATAIQGDTMISLRDFKLGTVAVAVAFGLAGCSKEEPKTEPVAEATREAPPPQETVVRIGHAAPLTGGIAHLGKDNENGARLAIEEANAKGLTIAGSKVRFELIAEDDEEKPDKGPIIAQKFADAKVAGVVGHLNSGVTIPASAVYSQAGIPMVSGSATNPKLTEQGFKHIFRVVGRDDQQGPAVASYLASEFKPRTVAVIDDATAYGEGLANEVEKSIKSAGIDVLPREKGTKDTRDWKPILTKLRGRKPDAVFYGGMDATGGPLLKQGRELGIKAVFAFGDGACTEEMKKLAGEKHAEGLICSQAGIPAVAASKEFLQSYRARFNVEPILYSPFTFDAANLLIAAMQKADSVDPAKFLPALAGMRHKGASGDIEFDEKGDRKDPEMTIFTMKEGRLAPVAIVKAGTTTRFEEFMKAAEAAGAAAREAMGKAGEAVSAGADAAREGAAKAVDAARDAGGKAVETAKDVAGRAVGEAKDMAAKAIEGAKDAAGKAADGAKDMVKQ
jgi:branched-chain amino acid transport system substrate-binding protein